MELLNGGLRKSRDLPPYRVVLGVDARGFSDRPSLQQTQLNVDVRQTLVAAFRRAGIEEAWQERRFAAHTGDGYVLGLPTRWLPHLLHPLLRELQVELEERDHRRRADEPRLRLRLSIHLGPLPDHGVEEDGVGTPMTVTHRLLDSEAVRRYLDESDETATFLAAIVSRQVFEDVVQAGYTALRPTQFVPVDASAKGFADRAYVHVPVLTGGLLRSGLAMGSDQPRAGPAVGKDLPSESPASMLDAEVDRVYATRAEALPDMSSDLRSATDVRILASRGNELQRETFEHLLFKRPAERQTRFRVLLPVTRGSDGDTYWMRARESEMGRFDPSFQIGMLAAQIEANVRFLQPYVQMGTVELRRYSVPHLGRVLLMESGCYLTMYTSHAHGRDSVVVRYRRGPTYDWLSRFFETVWQGAAEARPL